MLTYTLVNGGHATLGKKIIALETHLAPIFPELDRVILRVRMRRLRRAVAEYDYRSRRIDIDPRHFEPDEENRLPSVLAHETMHAVQHIDRTIPFGERSCDLFMLARLPVELYPLRRDFYLKVPEGLIRQRSGAIRETALRAISLRAEGLRNYMVWFEQELKRISVTSNRSRQSR